MPRWWVGPVLCASVVCCAVPAAHAQSVRDAAPLSDVRSGKLPRVPNVVGKPAHEAERELRQAGYDVGVRRLEAPDGAVPPGHVSATIPAPGTFAAGGTIEIQIPRAATRVGIGGLSVQDTERRTGFDLDEGRYEEISRGADLVLRAHKARPQVDPTNGSTYYEGGGIYLEPSDGAILAPVGDDRSISQYGLGDFTYYFACQAALKGSHADRVEVSLSSATVCVVTPKGIVGVVEFRAVDNPYPSTTSFKFRTAVFPGNYFKALGRVRPANPASPPATLCEAAASARARNSPAAAGLEAQCRAFEAQQRTDDALVARGESIAGADAPSAALRDQQPDGPARRGFAIGLAAAEGQSAPGPGKDQIRTRLQPDQQAGFDVAVSFSLDRNRNALLAEAGASIAERDPTLAEPRSHEADVRYGLGFDIATGLFGDPALGAKGNTAIGPGSLAIRNGLNPISQRGYDAAVALHLARRY